MHPEDLSVLIAQGENDTVEFKQARSALNKDVFETVCAFLNRSGGHLVLGVKDNGEIVGVDPQYSSKIKQELVTGLNNPQLLSPPFALSPQSVTLAGQEIIVLYVPESSQVHHSRGKIFERYEDGDLNLTHQTTKVAELYLRKQKTFTENTVYPYVELGDLRADLLKSARQYAQIHHQAHPWATLNDMEMIRSARLYRKDYETGKSGFTLAAVLLLGSDEVIQNILTHYRIDGILRVNDLYRYDDRIDIRTNLLDAYKELSAFIDKHLPDPFYLEGDLRVSLRSKIFREAIANVLVHREYTLANPSRVIIERDRVIFENANRPAQFGPLDPLHFTPHPKNPIILRFFREMNFSEELGSGIKSTFRYAPLYTPGRQASFTEGPLFVTEIPIPPLTNLVTGALSGPIKTQNGSANDQSGSANDQSGSANDQSGSANAKWLDDLAVEIQNRVTSRLQAKTLTQITALLAAISQQEGGRREDYQNRLKTSTRTMLRYLAQLKSMGLIEFKGGTKSGGYFLEPTFKKTIHPPQ